MDKASSTLTVRNMLACLSATDGRSEIWLWSMSRQPDETKQRATAVVGGGPAQTTLCAFRWAREGPDRASTGLWQGSQSLGVGLQGPGLHQSHAIEAHSPSPRFT